MYKIMSAQCSHHRVIKFHNCCIQASTISASGHHWNPSLPFPGWLVRNITPLARRKQQESPPLSYHTIPSRTNQPPFLFTKEKSLPTSASRPNERKKKKKKNPLQGDIFRVWTSASHNSPTPSFLFISSDFFHLDDFAQPIPLVFSALIGCCVGELDSMLRDELLRSKNDEIAYVINFAVFYTFCSIDCDAFHLATFIWADGRINSRHCLLSRKRKLTELYFATVGFAGATDGGGGGALADSRYRQKEQAFLDANDLSK